MATIIYMPKWGSAMTQGKIVSWSREEGEAIESGEALVEIETEKITNLVEAPVSGIVRKVLVPEGEAAPVSAPIAVITAVDEEWDGKLGAAPESSQTSGAPGLRRQGPPGSSETREQSAGVSGNKAVTPAARSLAKKRGIDLTQISGSGTGGRIVLEDLFDYLALQTGWPGSRFIPVGDCLTHYLDLGQGFPLVLLHGLGASGSAWQPNLHYLANYFRVLAPDLPGAGLSDSLATGYTLEFYTGFLGDFLDYLGIDRCVIVGNSLGGAIAVAFARHFPGKVSGLVLEDCAGLGQEVTPELRPAVLDSVSREGISKLLGLLFHDPKFVFPGTIEELYRYRQRPGAYEALKSAVENQLGDEGQKIDVSKELAQISLPTLVIWGAEDRITPLSQGVKVAGLLPKGSLTAYEGCGHCPHIEQADRFNQEVARFVRELLE